MSEHIYRMLVRDEEDVVGALAYSLYKMHLLTIVIIGAAVLGLRASDALTAQTGQAVGTNAAPVAQPEPAPH
jgi:hypothetical protein